MCTRWRRDALFVTNPCGGLLQYRAADQQVSQRRRPRRPRRPRATRTRRARRVCASGAEPVEVARLRPVGADGCSEAEVAGIGSRIASWLDAEFPEELLKSTHADIGMYAAELYADIRKEGEDEVGAVLLQLGTRLEEANNRFVDMFVGPWEVANKVAEFVIVGAQAFSTACVPASIGDAFERYVFVQRLLDGAVQKEEVNGAVALAVGFRAHRFGWNGDAVSDAHFRQFGDVPPDVVGDATGVEWTETLRYMTTQLQDEEEGEEEEEEALEDDEEELRRRGESLDMLIETLHGVELSKVQRSEGDEAFRKYEVIAKWLHVHASYGEK